MLMMCHQSARSALGRRSWLWVVREWTPVPGFCQIALVLKGNLVKRHIDSIPRELGTNIIPAREIYYSARKEAVSEIVRLS